MGETVADTSPASPSINCDFAGEKPCRSCCSTAVLSPAGHCAGDKFAAATACAPSSASTPIIDAIFTRVLLSNSVSNGATSRIRHRGVLAGRLVPRDHGEGSHVIVVARSHRHAHPQLV